MRYWKIIVPILLVALMILYFPYPTDQNKVTPPRLVFEPSTIDVFVCSEFRIELWIRDVDSNYPIQEFDSNIEVTNADLIDIIEDEGYLGEYPLTEDTMIGYVTIHCIGEGVTIFDIEGSATIDGQTIEMIDEDAVIRQHSRRVGGIFSPTNKFTILAPYLGLVGLVVAVASATILMRRRKS